MTSEFTHHLPDWMDGPIIAINAEQVASDCETWYRQTAKIGKAMAGPAAEVLATLRGRLEGFQEHLPLIKALRNPGLRDRHWDKISQSGLPYIPHCVLRGQDNCPCCFKTKWSEMTSLVAASVIMHGGVCVQTCPVVAL